MKLLLISNSFGVNLQTYAKELAKVNGLDLSIYTLYIGGCPLEDHAKNIKENNKVYELFIDGRTTQRYISISEALKLNDWDYISLQQASHLSGIISSYYPYLEFVYTYVRRECPNSKIIFHKTWAYSSKNPHKFNEVKSSLSSFNFKDSDDMKHGIDSCVNKINEEFKFDMILRSGDVIYEAMKEFDDVYDSEGFHLNNLGCYLIGLNLVRSLTHKRLKTYVIPEDFDKKLCEKAYIFVNNLNI